MIESPQVTEVHASFLQRSENTFDTVDQRIVRFLLGLGQPADRPVDTDAKALGLVIAQLLGAGPRVLRTG